MAGYRRLLGWVRPYRAVFLLGVGAAVVASALDGFLLALLIPLLRLLFGAASGIPDVPTTIERILAALVGGLLDPGDRGQAIRNVVLLVVATVTLKNVALVTAGWLGTWVQEGVARDLRMAIHDHLARMELGFFHRTKGGQLLSRTLADVDQAKTIASASLVSALQNAALVVVYLGILLSVSWRLAFLALATLPLVVLLIRPVLAGLRQSARDALDARGDIAVRLNETIEGARVVRAHGAEGYERARFSDALRRQFGAAVRTERIAVTVSPLSETLGAVAFVLLLIVGVRLSGDAAVQPAVFVAFVAVALRLLSPVKRLSQYPALAEQALAAADRVFDVLDRSADEADAAGARPFPGLRSRIEFRDVWARYDEEGWVLRGVSLEVSRGDVVALVGPSGAGKSTLVDLLPRFLEPERGELLVDGVAITRYRRRSLRAAIGIVSQHTVIFNDTVRNNIAYGDQSGASDPEVRDAARAANAAEFIERLPEGYDTVLGERGMRLSGGERQRIAIARALLRDPPILILDEATSNLDAESERLVRAAIAQLLADRTVLVVAHRLSTIADANRIVVMESGRIVESGTHGELIEAGGVYGRLYAGVLSVGS